MPIIKCGSCGGKVSDMAFVCPHCGLDVRALKASGNSCSNCGNWYIDDGEQCNYGPSGYPCLMWTEDDYYD